MSSNRHDRFVRRRLRGTQQTQQPAADARLDRLQGGDEVGQKALGALSPSSSDSQATGRRQPRVHPLTSVLFPEPAEAETSVSLRCRPSFIRSTRRGRLTTMGGVRGIYSFVAKIGTDMDQVYSISPKFKNRQSPGTARWRLASVFAANPSSQLR